MHRARVLGFAVVAFFAQACAGTTTAPVPPLPDPRTQMAALETRIFALVESERMKLDPAAKVLTLDSELTNAARAHSIDMASKNYLAHRGPDGTTAVDVFLETDATFQGILGENLAAEHFNVGYSIDVDQLAHRFLASWLASKSHKNNLAFSSYDRSGVGAAVSGNTIYVTQLFAVDLGDFRSKADPEAKQATQSPDAQPAKDAPSPEMPRGHAPPG